MKTVRAIRTHGFTLIELLVVIAIIAVVAGLVVGLARVAGENKREKRTQTELAKLITMIETYKAKVGIYPPDNPSNPDVNSLLYELAGSIRDRSNDVPPEGPTYITPFDNITSNEIWITYGGTDVFPDPHRNAGLLNAVEKEGNADDAKVHRILTNLQRDQTNNVSGHLSLVVPIDGPNGRPNPWNYLRGTNAIHNPDSYDIWVVIKTGGQLRTNGNWKN